MLWGGGWDVNNAAVDGCLVALLRSCPVAKKVVTNSHIDVAWEMLELESIMSYPSPS
jgi:hypothetical protein